jgi:hypothetical protein
LKNHQLPVFDASAWKVFFAESPSKKAIFPETSKHGSPVCRRSGEKQGVETRQLAQAAIGKGTHASRAK